VIELEYERAKPEALELNELGIAREAGEVRLDIAERFL
jgi:hypothetical protein